MSAEGRRRGERHAVGKRRKIFEKDTVGHFGIITDHYLTTFRRFFPDRVQTLFQTSEQGKHVGDEYFLNSNDKVSVGMIRKGKHRQSDLPGGEDVL